MSKDQCKACGKCCRAIWLNYPMDKIKDIMKENPNHKDAPFIIENWTQISTEKALKINPYLKNHKEGYYFTCSKLDKETNKCGDYENRPQVCSGFPFYGKNLLGEGFMLYSNKCGFHKKANFENGISHRIRIKMDKETELKRILNYELQTRNDSVV